MIEINRLKELFKYDPYTGIFTRIKVSNRWQIGSVAGSLSGRGYFYIKIDGKSCSSHRLAWLYMTGSFPVNEIDHINNIKTDNRFCNLREATRSENMLNRPAQINNKTGIKGVSKFKNRYVAETICKGRRFFIGSFDTPKEAGAAYKKFSEQHHGEFYCE